MVSCVGLACCSLCASITRSFINSGALEKEREKKNTNMGKESQLDVKGQITITERGHGLLFLDQLKKKATPNVKCQTYSNGSLHHHIADIVKGFDG